MMRRSTPIVLFAALAACHARPEPENLQEVELVLDVSP